MYREQLVPSKDFLMMEKFRERMLHELKEKEERTEREREEREEEQREVAEKASAREEEERPSRRGYSESGNSGSGNSGSGTRPRDGMRQLQRRVGGHERRRFSEVG
ncbi:MAG: hypothetical protein JO356_19520 [Acidobacteria bacterium]|nr:hypothetical protein [Acidobacteriota bacterium]